MAKGRGGCGPPGEFSSAQADRGGGRVGGREKVERDAVERPSATVVRAFAADLVTRRILVKSVCFWYSLGVWVLFAGVLREKRLKEEKERRKRGRRKIAVCSITTPFFVIEYSGLL